MNDINNINKQKRATMEISRISASLLVTVVIAFATFTYTTGIYRNELKNVKEQQLTIKKDLKEEIRTKADQKVVDLIFQKLNAVDEKLDKLIISKTKGK